MFTEYKKLANPVYTDLKRGKEGEEESHDEAKREEHSLDGRRQEGRKAISMDCDFFLGSSHVNRRHMTGESSNHVI